MCFGHHGNPENGVALFFHEGRKAYVFTAYGNDRMVRKVETGQVRLGVGVQAQNLVTRQFQLPDGPLQVVGPANSHFL